MGHVGSKEEEERIHNAIEKLSKIELKNIEDVFSEMSLKTDSGQKVIEKPSWLNRESFANRFGLPDLLGEQLFLAFDRDGNGKIDLDEFVSGMALCLHGKVQDKCKLLFKIFNLNDDEGISREELTTILNTAVSGAKVVANTIAAGSEKNEEVSVFEDIVAQTVRIEKIVNDAFDTCDVSKTGKLEIDEFAQWIIKNSKLVKSFFAIECPKPAGEVQSQTYTLPESGVQASLTETIQSPSSHESPQTSTNPEITFTVDDQLDELEKVKSLSDLFKSSDLSPIRDKEGQHFFDSLTGLEGTESVPLSEATSVENLADQHLLNDSMTNLLVDSKSSCDEGDREGLKEGLSQDDVYSDAVEVVESKVQSKSHGDVDLQLDQGHVGDEVSTTSQSEPGKESTGTTSHVQTFFQSGSGDDYFSQLIGKPTLQQLALGREERQTELGTRQLPFADMENIACFWPYVSQTKLLIEAAQKGTEIDSSHLTYPYVMMDNTMGDPVKDLVAKFLGEQEASKRPMPTVDAVTMNDAGLMDLLNAKCWRGAVDFTARYLAGHGQGPNADMSTRLIHTPKMLQVWLIRLSLLFKLRMFSSAEAELNAFGGFDKPDLFFEFYPNIFAPRKGSIVPFSLRVIYAEIPQHNGRPNESLDRMYKLLENIQLVIRSISIEHFENISANAMDATFKEAALKMWRGREIRVLYAIGNCLLGMKEYQLAAKVFMTVTEKVPETKPSILSGIGRLHLQLGDLPLAQKLFKKVDNMALGDPKTLSIVVMNKGFYALSQGRYQDAYDHFLSVTKLDPDNASAYNNASVCLLFLGRVKEASTLLETLIWRAPAKHLHEDVLFNLCTIYELETSRALQKKQKLLDLVSRHNGDGFNVQCLKLN